MRSSRSALLPFLAGAGTGLVVAWLAEPRLGRGRRVMLHDKAVSAWRDLRRAARGRLHDLRLRTHGRLAETRARLRPEPVDDRVLGERVRAELGHAVSHPHAIVVAVEESTVTLSGSILSAEEPDLVRRVRRVRGVAHVVNRLETFTSTVGVPALQGGARRSGRRDPHPR